ncbi:hypothetical protein POM88_034659 [Heracleum sosnowskyi]|uniref:non-specific serine/threonine protein kinase n=1 Tax=Heracleum sosnowskyi TaxID=360622 RepID=A0AAD8HLX5_9APIA|nr:hypothetical protein POM88_034652 [Heracleum sosnowskyi]KAK1368567.1 hypothetical protein POM88_034659 [Heracleum sosnowskyi]
MTINLHECRSLCIKNCSCTAYANAEDGCLLWFSDLTDIREYAEDGRDIYVRMASSELEKSRSSGVQMKTEVIIITAMSIVVLLVIIYRTVYKKRKLLEQENLNISLESVALTKVENEDLELPLFELERIANATSNFSNNNKLGEGGFGPVYKGTLDDGLEIAVKRLSKDSSQGLDEFTNEVSCIAKLQHRNLVTLYGCCTEKGEKILIYEYMANKSLDSFISDEKIRNTMDWPKSFGGNETEANTSRVVGTYGYMSPEYAIEGQFSVKSDVYSFGVLLIEIVSGVKNRLFSHPDHSLNLVGHAWMSYKEDKLLQIIDEVILESSNHIEVFRAIQIGLLCVQHDPKDRPVMSEVVLMLSSNIKLPHPKQPGFFMERCLLEADNLLSNPKFSLSNHFTITSLLPRH